MEVSELLAAARLPRHEAERLLVHASDGDRAALARPPDAATALRFQALVERRRAGEPLQYIEGTVQFGPLTLLADPRGLIPRPETEQLWEIVVKRLEHRSPERILDLCTGSGNLALALKHAFPRAEVRGTDLDAAALELARENGALLGLSVAWSRGDLFGAVPDTEQGRVDVIVANPPYVTAGEFAELPDDVRVHEPRVALVAGEAGDEILARIASAAMEWLRPGGLIACEIAEAGAESALRLFAPYNVEILDDLTNRPRFVIGSAPAMSAG